MRPSLARPASLLALHYIIGQERQWAGFADYSRLKAVSPTARLIGIAAKRRKWRGISNPGRLTKNPCIIRYLGGGEAGIRTHGMEPERVALFKYLERISDQRRGGSQYAGSQPRASPFRSRTRRQVLCPTLATEVHLHEPGRESVHALNGRGGWGHCLARRLHDGAAWSVSASAAACRHPVSGSKSAEHSRCCGPLPGDA